MGVPEHIYDIEYSSRHNDKSFKHNRVMTAGGARKGLVSLAELLFFWAQMGRE
jgi:hypothetical protein